MRLKFKDKKTVIMIQKCYLIISMLMFLFVNTEEAVGIEILVPHINGLVIYWHVALTIICIILITIVQTGVWKIDIIGKLLFLKCIFDLITFVLNFNSVPNGYFGYYACSLTAFTSYIILQQEEYDVTLYYKYFLVFGIILTFQTIWTSQLADIDFLDIFYKSHLNIPYGATNIIASALVPLLILPFFMDLKKIVKIILCIIIEIGIIFTKSRGGVLLSILTILSAVCFTDLIKRNRHLKKIIISIIFVIIIIILLGNDNIDVFLSGYMNGKIDTNSFTSGRLDIFLQDFVHFFDKPLFGHGLGSKGTNIVGSHNILIDLLYKCGLIGFITYGLAIIKLFIGKIDKYFGFAIIIIFINSLFEVCYFSYKCDTLFWCMASLTMIKNTQNKRNYSPVQSDNKI